MTRPEATPPLPMVFWVIWFAILGGLLMMQFFAGGGIPSGADQDTQSVLFQVLALALAGAAVFVCFGVIPRLNELQQKLPAMIVGLALAESIGILGMFAVPHQYGATRVLMLSVSVVCIVLSAPTYAKSKNAGSAFHD